MFYSGFIGRLRGIFTSVAFWLVLLVIIVVTAVALSYFSVAETMAKQQLDLIEDTALRNAVQCYVLEGSYPPNLSYLIDNYGFNYDSENYVLHYENQGSNLLPRISAFSK